jgi:hypothetical protein
MELKVEIIFNMKIIPMVWSPMKVGDNKRSTIQMESFERRKEMNTKGRNN